MKGFSLDLYELHAQPSVKDTGDYGDDQKTILEDSSACYEAHFDSADAWAIDGIMGLLEKFTNAGIRICWHPFEPHPLEIPNDLFPPFQERI